MKFHVGQTVTIREIEQKGIVLAVQQDIQGVSVKVAYWFNGERREVWLLEQEINR